MTTAKHVILGAGGAITPPLTRELLLNGESVKLVSRKGYEFSGAESSRGDLTIANDVLAAVDPESVVYLLAGLPYNTRVWREQWPKVMQNAVSACENRNARLIFFDNVYTYGRVEGPMREDTPVRPCSHKGEIRARIADLFLSETKKGNLRGIIARSADFYGPYARGSSVPTLLVLERLASGKKPQWLANSKARHSFTYTIDCGKALCLLAKTESAYDQVWHLPTASPPITGEQFIAIAARKFGVDPDFTVLRKWMVRVGGVFDSLVKETYEMIYQSEHDYVFDSAKFEEFFKVTPTPYEKGIEEAIEYLKSGATR
jgi:nucleoside-diphosphate-sugar epimerase